MAVVVALIAPTTSALVAEKRLDDSTYYVVVAEPGAPAGMYRETNGCSGFQGTAQDCAGGAEAEPADEAVDTGDEFYTMIVDADNHTWAYVECTDDYVWDLLVEGDPAWCGVP